MFVFNAGKSTLDGASEQTQERPATPNELPAPPRAPASSAASNAEPAAAAAADSSAGAAAAVAPLGTGTVVNEWLLNTRPAYNQLAWYNDLGRRVVYVGTSEVGSAVPSLHHGMAHLDSLDCCVRACHPQLRRESLRPF